MRLSMAEDDIGGGEGWMNSNRERNYTEDTVISQQQEEEGENFAPPLPSVEDAMEIDVVVRGGRAMIKNVLQWMKDDAPPELLPRILSFCGSRRLNALSVVNKKWNAIINEESVWRVMCEDTHKVSGVYFILLMLAWHEKIVTTTCSPHSTSILFRHPNLTRSGPMKWQFLNHGVTSTVRIHVYPSTTILWSLLLIPFLLAQILSPLKTTSGISSAFRARVLGFCSTLDLTSCGNLSSSTALVTPKSQLNPLVD